MQRVRADRRLRRLVSFRLTHGQFSFLVMLKTFQRLGYFCQFEFIPHSIIDHIRSCLNLGEKYSAIAPERSRRRYRDAIRQYLKISIYNKQGQKILAKAVGQAATVRDPKRGFG